MDAETTQTTPAAVAPAGDTAPAGEAAQPAQSFEQDLADLATKSQSITPEPTPPPDEAPAAETEPATEEPAAETPAATEKPAEPKLPQRLAMVAAATRKNETRAQELEGREQALTAREAAHSAKVTADLQLLEGIRTAPSKVTRIQAIVGGEDQLRDLYLELTDHFNGEAPRTAPAARSAASTPADIEKLVKSEVDKRLADADSARSTAAQAATREAKAGYVQAAHRTLDASASEFPLCFAAPPTAVAITAISDEILRQTGGVPPVKTVLKMIEDERQARHQRAANKTPAAPKPATSAKPAEQTSGAPTSRRTSVPVTPARTLTFEEELAQVAAKYPSA